MVKKKENWRIWNKDRDVEVRTFQRVKKNLPEMECAKQLRKIFNQIYKKEMRILDVGCAAGHYYNSLIKIDKNISYTGMDATKAYIAYGKKHFKKNTRVNLIQQDIFKIDNKYNKNFDITFCCNVLLHLPEIKKPIINLLKTTKKYCIIRTLVSNKTHFSQFLYSDKFNKNNKPTDFVYQNTYSFDLLKKIIKTQGKYQIDFINDKFESKNINKEFYNFNKKQSAVTKILDNKQIAGSKVFEWKWILIKK